jgi:hypothetical protein
MSSDFFYVSGGISFLVIAGLGGYASYRLAKTMRVIESVVRDVKDTTRDVKWVKNRVKYGVLGIISALISK